MRYIHVQQFSCPCLNFCKHEVQHIATATPPVEVLLRELLHSKLCRQHIDMCIPAAFAVRKTEPSAAFANASYRDHAGLLQHPFLAFLEIDLLLALDITTSSQ